MQDCFRLLEVRKTLICIASGLLESSGKWKQFSFIYSQSYSSFCHLFLPGQPFPFLTFMSGCCTRTTRIDFTWALERIASKFCKFKILPLLLSESSWQICFFRRKKKKFSFYFLSVFSIYSCPFFASMFFPFTTLIPSNIDDLPLVTFPPLLPFLLHLYPYLVFLIVTQVTRSQP